MSEFPLTTDREPLQDVDAGAAPVRSAMTEPQPILTLAIPTYNRAAYVRELLEALWPQVAGERRVELLVANNASTDETGAMVERMIAEGLPARLLSSPVNVGADGNFLRCLGAARGRYCWIFGDDDMIVADALPRLLSAIEGAERTGGVDLIYFSSFGFSGTYRAPAAEELRDRLGRFAEVVTDREYFVEKVNALLGLISVVAVNREALAARRTVPLEELHATNLMQMGWVLPPLATAPCRTLYVWERLVGYRSHNSGGWGIAEVFGLRLATLADRYFGAGSAMSHALMSGVLRFWMMDSIMLARTGREREMHTEPFAAVLRPRFGGNWRYWVFCHPVATLPLPVARVVHAVLRGVNRLWRAVQGVWRHVFLRGELIWPAVAGVGHPPAGRTQAERARVTPSSASTTP